jgi:hypothetical protein
VIAVIAPSILAAALLFWQQHFYFGSSTSILAAALLFWQQHFYFGNVIAMMVYPLKTFCYLI